MSAVLLPDIGALDPDGLCHSIYSQLYHNFFNAQDKNYILEGDNTSILLHNTAYNFASAIAGAIGGDGTESGGGVLLGYLKKAGGDMTGMLRANYGFEAGTRNRCILSFTDEGAVISGDLKLGGSSLYLEGRQVLRYDALQDIILLDGKQIELGSARLYGTGEILLGADKVTGVYITPALVQIGGKDVYHSGNANRTDVSWNMLDASVSGTLQVSGAVELKSTLTALHGIDLGTDGKTVLSIHSDTAVLSGYLSFSPGFGIRIGDLPVLMRNNGQDIQLGAPGGDLLLGSEETKRVRLQSALWDIDGDTALISRYGSACFPGSIIVRHNYGDDLLSSYHKDRQDEGIIIHKSLRMGSSTGATLYGKGDALSFASRVYRMNDENTGTVSYPYETTISFSPSTSLYQRQDRYSDTFRMSTGADFFGFDKPVEATGHIGIDGSLTRLADNTLFFRADSYLLSAADGILHYGNARFMNGISSEHFSSGFAGSGWAILRNGTTGNIQATFDEVIVRKKMRVYEMEVQKNSATNGSLWITDSCSGDTVVCL